MRCESNSKISEVVNISVRRVEEIIAKIRENSELGNSAFFRDFEKDGSALRISDIWNFSKATNEVKHFGNIPPENMLLLLFYPSYLNCKEVLQLFTLKHFLNSTV